MTTRVDPFIQPIPEQFSRDRELRSYFEYLHRVIHDLRNRTGGSDDQVTNLGVRELYPYSPQKEEGALDGAALFGRPLNADLLGALNVVSTSADYTTTGNEIIICTNTNDITITLNVSPEDTEQVHIVRQNVGGVTISGTINGQSSLVIGQRYSSPHLVYTNDGGEWSII